jgi:hypothetical protein
MNRFALVSSASLLVLYPLALGAVTLTSLESNNTSACTDSSKPQSYCYQGFSGKTDTDFSPSVVYEPAPANTSKVSISKLMYGSSTTLFLAHFQPWFYQGDTQKVATGYTSDKPATVAAQMNDMISRGFKGVVIDWYGQYGGDTQSNDCSNPTDTAFDNCTVLNLQSNLAPRCSGAQDCPMYFALMEDKGALAVNGCSTTDSSTAACIAALEKDLSYMSSSYFGSAAYLKLSGNAISSSGRPVVFLFLLPGSSYNGGATNWCNNTGATTDWCTVWNTVLSWAQANAGNPLFFFESNPNPSALNSAYGWPATQDPAGVYAWPNWNAWDGKSDLGQVWPSDPFGFDYLKADFYAPTVAYDKDETIVGAAWKGFDDSNAWGFTETPNHPVMPQQCGLTWVQAFQQMATYYDSSNQLPFLGVATWNDYDEGTEIETGIDNCVSTFTEAISGDTLTWSISFGSVQGYSGSEATVYQYIVYYTTDGTTLTEAGTVKSGTHTTNLCTLDSSIPSGATIYVEAEGMPSIFNHLVTNPQKFAGTCS